MKKRYKGVRKRGGEDGGPEMEMVPTHLVHHLEIPGKPHWAD